MSQSISVREAISADAAAIARVNVDTWRTTYASLLPGDFLASRSYEHLTAGFSRRIANPVGGEFIYVAKTSDGEVVGHATGGPERTGDAIFTGDLYALYVLAAYQRQGIGQGLFLQTVSRLTRTGRASLLIWVLAANPARAFYEFMGGQPVRTRTTAIGGVHLEEVGYGWMDTTPLTRLAAANGADQP